VVKQATFAEASAAIITVELIAVPNVIPAFAAFYGSIDDLKHHTFRSSELAFKKRKERAIWPFNSCGLARFDRSQQ
jgi:hypothetical protein